MIVCHEIVLPTGGGLLGKRRAFVTLIFHGFNGYEVRSAGTEENARIKVTSGHIGWADLIFVMEKKHNRRLKTKFGSQISTKKIVCLDIPDDYKFMDIELIEILKSRLSETLTELASDKKYLGARIGFSSVLHTWGQALMHHPHIHCIVPGGGLSYIGKWVNSRKKFFIPVKVLSRLFRGKFLYHLKQLNKR